MFYNGWADHQRQLLYTLRPLTPDHMRLRASPTEWAIWQLASNMVGGRLYWLCWMLRQENLGVSDEWAGWEDHPDHPRTADEVVEALEMTWSVVEACLDRWSLDDLSVEVTSKDFWGRMQTITPAWVINRLLTHEVFHGSEIALILRMHRLPTALAG